MTDTDRASPGSPAAVVRRLRSSRESLYVQAIDQLTGLVTGGTYHPGDRLPTETELAGQMGVSRATVREAIGHLETDGLVTRRQGSGTFVAAGAGRRFTAGFEQLVSFRSLAAAEGMEEHTVWRTAEPRPATPELAKVLRVPPGTEVMRVRTVEAVNGVRTVLFDTSILASRCDPDELRAHAGSVIDYLTARDEPRLRYTRSFIAAVPAGQDAATSLGVEPGRAVLEVHEVFYGSDGVPIGAAWNYWLTDELRFTLVRRVPRRDRALLKD